MLTLERAIQTAKQVIPNRFENSGPIHRQGPGLLSKQTALYPRIFEGLRIPIGIIWNPPPFAGHPKILRVIHWTDRYVFETSYFGDVQLTGIRVY